MAVSVSVSNLRKNISAYLEKVMNGTRVIVRDEKRDIAIAEIIHTSSFDKATYEKALRKAVGVFSEKNHPEWKTEQGVTDWVSKSRLSDDRSF
jgi:antitoxin (DNA-binding transcriptional repressor) of toxin-antitoxin stability system